MIYIVHGEDISKSRIVIQNQQKKVGADSRIEVDVSEITPEELHEKGFSNDLFGNPPFIVLNVTGTGKTDMEPYIKVMEKLPEPTTLIIMSGKSLPKTNVFIKNSARLKAKLNLYEITPQSNIFNFVDAVFSKHREKAYNELSKLLKDQVSPFEIFSMLFYGLRTLASAKFQSPSLEKSHSFVKMKSQSQAKMFAQDQIIDIFEKFRKLDMASKLSEIDEDLVVPMAIETVLNS